MKISRKISIWPFLILIKVYQQLISPFLGKNCRFVPSCSFYAREALKTYGILYGFFLGIKRILRCHPWSKGGYEPLPKEKNI